MTLTDEFITPDRLEELLADDSIALAHRTLWLLLWEGELRVLDLLSLSVEEVHLAEKQMRYVSGKAGTLKEAGISERAADLLTELIGDRKTGPLFAVGERALGWEEAVKAAGVQGHAIHAFWTGGKAHRVEEAAPGE